VLEALDATATIFVSVHHVLQQEGFWTDILWRHRRAAGVAEAAIIREIVEIRGRFRHRAEDHVRDMFGAQAFHAPPGTARPMTAEDLCQTARHPRFFIGNHTCRHVPLTFCDETVAQREIVEAQATLTDLSGHTPLAIAYPHGLCNARIRAMATRAGLKLGFTTAARKSYLDSRGCFTRSMALGRFTPRGSSDVIRQARYFRSDLMIHQRYQSGKNCLKAMLRGTSSQM
jgi:peptidoglycan/xylan/chitin deacetylase (PgdA/CDA1 family)